MRFGPYELIELLAEGELADVFRARMLVDRTSRPVALKRYDPTLSQDDGFAKILLDEARIASRLEHPNIVRVFDFGIIDESCYLATDFVDGLSLAHIAGELSDRGESIPIEFALHVGLAACDALAFAHQGRRPDAPLGIVHRDIGPSNILVAFDGSVKLTDFGIVRARRYLREVITELSREECGYLSPEEVQGESVDGRSDLFSLGTVLHELFTGVPLFARANSVSTVQQLLRGEIPPPSRSRVGIATELDRVVLRALSREISARYQDAETMRGDLHRYAQDASMLVEDSDLAVWMQAQFLPSRLLLRSQSHERASQLGSGSASPTPPVGDPDTDVDPSFPPSQRARRRTLSLDDDASTTRKQQRRARHFAEAFERSTVRNAKMASRPVRDESTASVSAAEIVTKSSDSTPSGYLDQDTLVQEPSLADLGHRSPIPRALEHVPRERLPAIRSSGSIETTLARPRAPMDAGEVAIVSSRDDTTTAIRPETLRRGMPGETRAPDDSVRLTNPRHAAGPRQSASLMATGNTTPPRPVLLGARPQEGDTLRGYGIPPARGDEREPEGSQEDPRHAWADLREEHSARAGESVSYASYGARQPDSSTGLQFDEQVPTTHQRRDPQPSPPAVLAERLHDEPVSSLDVSSVPDEMPGDFRRPVVRAPKRPPRWLYVLLFALMLVAGGLFAWLLGG